MFSFLKSTPAWKVHHCWWSRWWLIWAIMWTMWTYFFLMSGLDGDKHSFNSSLMSKGDGDIRKPKSLPCTHSLRLCAWWSVSNGSAYDEVTRASYYNRFFNQSVSEAFWNKCQRWFALSMLWNNCNVGRGIGGPQELIITWQCKVTIQDYLHFIFKLNQKRIFAQDIYQW